MSSSPFDRPRGTRIEDFERPWSGAWKGAPMGMGGALIGAMPLFLTAAPFRSNVALGALVGGGLLGGAIGGALFGHLLWREGKRARWRDVLLVIPAWGLGLGFLAFGCAGAGQTTLRCDRSSDGNIACRLEERRWLGLYPARAAAWDQVRSVEPWQPVGTDRGGGFLFKTNEFDHIVDDFGPGPTPDIAAFLASTRPSFELTRDDRRLSLAIGAAGLAACVGAWFLTQRKARRAKGASSAPSRP
jgi:hypothetical protein